MPLCNFIVTPFPDRSNRAMKGREKGNRDHQKDEVGPILRVTPVDYDSLSWREAYPGRYDKGLQNPVLWSR